MIELRRLACTKKPIILFDDIFLINTTIIGRSFVVWHEERTIRWRNELRADTGRLEIALGFFARVFLFHGRSFVFKHHWTARHQGASSMPRLRTRLRCRVISSKLEQIPGIA